MTTVGRLEALAGGWEAAADRRFLFARAYALMTTAMLARVEGGGFADPQWVHRLLDRFADYYFVVADPAVMTPEHPCPLAVSYTHLDVYKRQARPRCCGRSAPPSVCRGSSL